MDILLSGLLLSGTVVCSGAQTPMVNQPDDADTWVGFCAAYVGGLPLPQTPASIQLICADLGN